MSVSQNSGRFEVPFPASMTRRPKSISVTAMLFSINALIIAFSLYFQISFYFAKPNSASAVKLVLIVILMVIYTILAFGLWRLKVWARFAGIIVAIAQLVYSLVAIYLYVDFQAFGRDEWFGFVISLPLWSFWICGPLYFLIRHYNAYVRPKPMNS
jgi:hypothetical protein